MSAHRCLSWKRQSAGTTRTSPGGGRRGVLQGRSLIYTLQPSLHSSCGVFLTTSQSSWPWSLHRPSCRRIGGKLFPGPDQEARTASLTTGAAHVTSLSSRPPTATGPISEDQKVARLTNKCTRRVLGVERNPCKLCSPNLQLLPSAPSNCTPMSP